MSTEHRQQQQDSNTAEQDAYDDACDLGQFFLNPVWFVIQNLTTTRRKRKNNTPPLQPPSKRFQLYCYYAFLLIGWGICFWRAYPLVWAASDISNIHPFIGYIVLASCLMSWRCVAVTSPGIITAETIQKYDNYEYDNVLYCNNSNHLTLGTQRKLARSKYDKYTQKQVARFDHYCGYIDQSIGEENYRWFLLFLTVHCLMVVYGTLMVGRILAVTTTSGSIWGMFTVDHLLSVWLLVMGLGTIVIVSFTSFHLYLVVSGQTTNEYYKWKGVQNHSQLNYYDQGVVRNILEVLYPRSLYPHGKHA